MRTSYTFLVVLFCTLLYYSCAAGQRVITSANTCVRDADCKEGYEYCDDNYQCRLRLNRNATCRSSYNCMDGLYCADKNGRQFCAPKVPLSGKCSQVSDFPCAMTGETVNKCSILSETCGPFGGVGGRCNVAADCQTGLYCKNRASGNAKCAMKKPNGMPCGVAMGVGRNSFTDPYECQGYCAMDQSNDIGGGVCTSTSGIGQACTESSQCVGFDDAPFDPMMQGKSKIVCNIPKTDIGICVDEQDLIKKEGMKCNPMKDTCDAERGLSCRKTSSGPVCMFNAFDSDVAVIKFCDINGKNSKCNPQDGIPTVCRRNTDPNLDFDFKQFFECHRKIETIKQGSLCSTETFAMCETGTMCKHVPGVLSDTKFCVVENQKGEKCFNNKFKYSCADGLKCENGMCVEGAPDETTTHADRYEDCTALPCMPNTECVMASGFKVCDLKSIEKSKGTCYSTALTTVVSFITIFLFFPFHNIHEEHCKNNTLALR